MEQRLNVSNVIARQQHGVAAVEAAAAWAMERAECDLTFVAALRAQNHPVDWLVRQHENLSESTNRPDHESNGL